MNRRLDTVPADLAAYRKALAEARSEIANYATTLSWPRREAAAECRRIVTEMLLRALNARTLAGVGK